MYYCALLWLVYTLHFIFAYLGPLLTTMFENLPTNNFIDNVALLWLLYTLNISVHT
jgi:hypothetical protein